MYQVYTSANKSLVFPVMCDGFLKIDYEDNIADTQLSSGTDVAVSNFVFMYSSCCSSARREGLFSVILKPKRS